MKIHLTVRRDIECILKSHYELIISETRYEDKSFYNAKKMWWDKPSKTWHRKGILDISIENVEFYIKSEFTMAAEWIVSIDDI